MRGLNKVMLIGRLGKDPDMVYFEGSDTVKASFTMATNEVYRDREGNKIEKTDWHNVVMWRGLARVAEKYLRKGSRVYVEGKLKTRSWEDQNGTKRYITEVEVLDLQMLDSRQQQQQQQSGYQQQGDYNQGGEAQQQKAAPTVVSSGKVHEKNEQANQALNTTTVKTAPVVEDDLPF